MRYLSVVLMVLMFVGSATISAAQEKKAEVKKAEKKIVLPEAVAKAVGEAFPNVEIDNTEMEKDSGITLYDIEFKDGRGEVEVAESGTIMEVTTFVKMADVPAAVAEVIQKAAPGAAIKEIEKAETRAEIKKEGKTSRIVKIANPTFVYEVEFMKGKERGEMQVAPDGKIVKALKWASGDVEKD